MNHLPVLLQGSTSLHYDYFCRQLLLAGSLNSYHLTIRNLMLIDCFLFSLKIFLSSSFLDLLHPLGTLKYSLMSLSHYLSEALCGILIVCVLQAVAERSRQGEFSYTFPFVHLHLDILKNTFIKYVFDSFESYQSRFAER